MFIASVDWKSNTELHVVFLLANKEPFFSLVEKKKEGNVAGIDLVLYIR